jgi:hypothetical protein
MDAGRYDGIAALAAHVETSSKFLSAVLDRCPCWIGKIEVMPACGSSGKRSRPFTMLFG